jgi:secondary thiamine-phosphate synthase enzyme
MVIRRSGTLPEGTAGVYSGAASFTVVHEQLSFETSTAPEFIDITNEVMAVVEASGVQAGQVTVFSNHTTAAIKINENEPLLLQDLARVLAELAPVDAEYEHNDFTRRTVNMTEDECANGHAHCQHLFLSASETVPVINGRLALGMWQRIFLIELDHARSRQVMVTVLGLSL